MSGRELESERGDVLHFLRQAFQLYLRPYWREQLVLLFTVLPAVALNTYLPLSLKTLLDKALPNHDRPLMMTTLGLLMALLLIASLAEVVQIFVRAGFGSELKKDLRHRLFEHLQSLPISFFDRLQPGEITALFAKEVVTLRDVYRNLVVRGLKACLNLMTCWLALIALTKWFGLLSLLALPYLMRSQLRSIRTAETADYEDKMADARVAFAVHNEMSLLPLLRAYQVGGLALDRFTRQVLGRSGRRRTLNTYDRTLIRKVQASPTYVKSRLTISMENNLSYLAVICGGAYLCDRGLVSIGTFSATLTLVYKIHQSMSIITAFLQECISAANALERIERILREPSAHLEGEKIDSVRGQYRCENASFGYNDEGRQLYELNFSLPEKGLVTLVGRSGSGKTTLMRLLARLYDPQEGCIYLDDRPLREISPESLQGQIAVVLQERIVFNGTIKENLILTSPKATMEQLEQVTRAVDLYDAIIRMPREFDSDVGDGGRRLSVGQRQRLALARALLSKPKVLLLDEATSSLDPETEGIIFQLLRRLAKDRMVLLLTHRPPPLSDEEFILVLDGGRIVQQGYHAQLMNSRGHYRRMRQALTGFLISQDGRSGQVTGEHLATIDLFADLPQDRLDELAGEFSSQFYEPDDWICQEGELGHHFFLLARGQVSVLANDLKVATLEDGDYFGEEAALHGTAYATTVRARYPSLVLSLHRDALSRLLGDLRGTLEDTAMGRSLSLLGRRGRAPGRMAATWDELLTS